MVDEFRHGGAEEIYLLVTVDTEEDNWGNDGLPPRVSNIQRIPELQRFLQDQGARPTYLVDYPVTTDCSAIDVLAPLWASASCEIGAHLHPWVNPPLLEEASGRNTMLCNLQSSLQRAKLQTLTETIERNLGARPVCFRAGRWGFGAETARALVECGYQVDSSVTPFVSWTETDEGPSFESFPYEPYWMDFDSDIARASESRVLLEMPVTIGFNRREFGRCHKLYELMGERPLALLRLRGIMHRLRLMQKLWLSPEVSSGPEMISLARIYLGRGVRVLNLMFHSSSLEPGLNPFVHDEAELRGFYRDMEVFFNFLHRSGRVRSVTLSEYRELLWPKLT